MSQTQALWRPWRSGVEQGRSTAAIIELLESAHYRKELMNKHYRQGDVVLLEIDSVPQEAVQELVSDDIVLALGEATGHSHRLKAPEGATYYALNDLNFFEIKHPSQLVHEEHDAIALTPGFYKVVRQREYTPERITRVID